MTEKFLGLPMKSCPKCHACWISGQHYWTGTGKLGNETELASLVCDMVNSEECVNPAKGNTKGNGWQKRLSNMGAIDKDIQRGLNE